MRLQLHHLLVKLTHSVCLIDQDVPCLPLQEADARHQHAEALQAAEQRISQAQASVGDLMQRHEAHIAELQASHTAELQQQATSLAQQLSVCSP